LTTFTETQFRYLFGRLRRPTAAVHGSSPDGLGIDQVPLRMRSASNPGGPGHDWVKARYVDTATRGDRVFLPARLSENPHMDRDAYLASLAELTEVERERLILGDWDAIDVGGMFEPSLWPTIARYSSDQWIRWWDMAGSKPTPDYPDPDWTVGLRLDRDRETGQCYVTDVVRFREDPATTEQLVRATAVRDGPGTVVVEQEPGSSGVALIQRYSRHVLHGLAAVHGLRSSGDKVTRARPVAAAAGRGEVTLCTGPWLPDLVSELRRFPHGKHDDIVDSLAGAYTHIEKLSGQLRTSSAVTARLPGARDRRLG
jgi:predicted phage terminase large subunit-like protein